jgi:hypothetical protein
MKYLYSSPRFLCVSYPSTAILKTLPNEKTGEKIKIDYHCAGSGLTLLRRGGSENVEEVCEEIKG